MIKRTTKVANLAVGIFSIVALLSIPLLAEEEHEQHDMPTLVPAPAKNCAMQQKCHGKRQEMCVKKMNQAIKAIDAATKAVETGHKATALAELKKAREVVASCRKSLSETAKAKFVNKRCPIMGTKLDPEKVPQNLTQMYMGRKLGFCCASCPEQWDKLSAEEKAKKLGEVFPSKTGQNSDSQEEHEHGH